MNQEKNSEDAPVAEQPSGNEDQLSPNTSGNNNQQSPPAHIEIADD